MSRDKRRRTSALVAILFDMELRAVRRDRAGRQGPEPFLLERAFEDCLERISLVRRRFARALLIGCPSAGWPIRLREIVGEVEVFDPGPLFAQAAGGRTIIEDSLELSAKSFDLAIAIGTLDTVNDLPRALRSIRLAMQPGTLLIGAMSGGDTLPQLRSAMRAADQATGEASAHVHPRIEAAAVAPLLTAAGFVDTVVDVDRAQVSYASLDNLVRDLRAMGATNVLSARSRRPVNRAGFRAAAANFEAAGDGERTIEVFEIIHFTGWTQANREG